MSDIIKHECGIALIRLKKSPSYYLEKYKTPIYGLNKLYLLMEKQHNRGQDGAGIATIKLDLPPGSRYISRHRSNSSQPIKDIFTKVQSYFDNLRAESPEKLKDAEWLKKNVPFTGELLLGHLRYGTHGRNSIEQCHPVLRQNNWMTKSLVLAGNFNMTNTDELFDQLVKLGQYPKEVSDTVTVLEKIGYNLDQENQRLFDQYKSEGKNHKEITLELIRNMNIQKVLSESARDFDGGYAMAGMIGYGTAFVMRDPSAIRPAHYYEDDEVVVAASERAAIQTAFNVTAEKIAEVPAAHALIIHKDTPAEVKQITEPLAKRSCSFERIYFSRGSDAAIYEERKRLGYLLTDQVLKAVNYDLENTVFSYVPNTAEVAFYGLVKGVEDYLNEYKKKEIRKLNGSPDDEKLNHLLSLRPRVEKIAIKDAKLRTFITEDAARDEMVAHVYDVTYGTVRPGKDTLVIVDDSIVRGTTLKQSIIRILDRLRPKKIIIVSSAPQIRYPDCYGIDMSRMKDFIAFRAAVDLLHQKGKQQILNEVYKNCKNTLDNPGENMANEVKNIYNAVSTEEISGQIARHVTSPDVKAEVEVIYQTIENLHAACPEHKGDWYFTGNYPTFGGNKVVNKAFVNFMEGSNERAY